MSDSNHYKETIQTWNNIAQRYEDKFMDLLIYDDSYDSFINLISNSNASILEIGCGPGNISKYILKRLPNANYLATDVSSNMIELAKKNNPSAEVAILDCREIDSLQKKFNAIICGFVIPYINANDCNKLFKDLSSKLMDNGLLYLSFVEGDTVNSGYISGSEGNRTYFHYYEMKFVLNELNNNGLNVLHVISEDYTKSNGELEKHVVIIADKMRF